MGPPPAHEDGTDSEAPLPPPPPPPPPPQVRPEDELKKKRPQSQSQPQPLKPKQKKKDFREILALFHDESADAARVKRVWGALWQTTLTEAQEEHKRRRQQEQHGLKRKKDELGGPMSVRGSLSRHGSLTQDHLKRARQVRAFWLLWLQSFGCIC
ncbi:hypothetical protein PHYSODRAFT_307583 [Phytophthora sojae]|uniref:Uncharacterized protein n=1 Tax=Phytophthora sojae (strain P6497) TaxID=1094619 RepID=G5AF98_PHYSP|nr:hypothetical protein PHYSODRAFT_307583 [Phytophthora sojae]EGZ05888.1 hypothetical protein PHYSODRAFT_307583 [Phytophthora sojae]|eukprot:XP_009538749.1 hypothetical protein PHYSODRAFT_307583 [Phytophthora sojae]